MAEAPRAGLLAKRAAVATGSVRCAAGPASEELPFTEEFFLPGSGATRGLTSQDLETMRTQVGRSATNCWHLLRVLRGSGICSVAAASWCLLESPELPDPSVCCCVLECWLVDSGRVAAGEWACKQSTGTTQGGASDHANPKTLQDTEDEERIQSKL